MPDGSVGEIAIAGANVSPGFWDPTRGIVPDPDRLAQLDGRTFLRAGDLGRAQGHDEYSKGKARALPWTRKGPAAL